AGPRAPPRDPLARRHGRPGFAPRPDQAVARDRHARARRPRANLRSRNVEVRRAAGGSRPRATRRRRRGQATRRAHADRGRPPGPAFRALEAHCLALRAPAHARRRRARNRRPRDRPAPATARGRGLTQALLRLHSRTFVSVRKSRNYRLFFLGQAVSLPGTWLQRAAQAWLILTLTHSGFAVGVLALAQF